MEQCAGLMVPVGAVAVCISLGPWTHMSTTEVLK